MSQLFFCLIFKTKPQPVFPGCRARYRSLHYNAPKPHLSWYRNQNSPRSPPECLSWVTWPVGIKGEYDPHSSSGSVYRTCPAAGMNSQEPTSEFLVCSLSDAELHGPRGSSSKEQGEVEGSRRSNSPWLRAVCVNRVSLSPQTDTRGGCPASCCAECAVSPRRGCGSVPQPKPPGCCHCSRACQ